jgi:hypothetical protein
MDSINKLRENFRLRPWWMNTLLLFCAFMSFIYLPWDFFFKPVAEDQEVWFGILLTGWAAKMTEPLHWLIYLAGTIGFWKMASWLHPWAALYTLQVAIGMLVWNVLDERGSGLLAGAITALPFLLLVMMLWREKYRFAMQSPQSDSINPLSDD